MLPGTMLVMRLQRIGRRNDPSYRIVVTDKRTGPKSDKHVDRLGSYNPKLDHVQLDAERAKEWLAKGVQASDTVHNILVSQKVIDAKKVNALPKKTPIVDPEAAATETTAAESATEAESAGDETEAEPVSDDAAEATPETDEADTAAEAEPEKATA